MSVPDTLFDVNSGEKFMVYFNKISRKSLVLPLLAILALLSACNSTEDLIDLALDPPQRRTIDTSRMGVNNFFIDPEFGTIPQQYSEIQNTLGLRSVRVLMSWVNAVQPSPSSNVNFDFFDAIIANIPAGVDVIIVVTGTPDWMTNPNNWDGGNPRATWVNRWLTRIVQRYGQQGGVLGFEVFNEPNFLDIPSDVALDLQNPDNYFELLSLSASVIRANAPSRLVIPAATLAINQSFPDNLNYNRRLRDLGAADIVDVWNIHYYSRAFERVVQNDGIADFLNGLGKPIWITESGETGPNNQLEYVETVWPFLRDEIPGIDRIYYYQFGETVLPVENNFGLRTTDPSFPVSDLYVHLRNRAAN